MNFLKDIQTAFKLTGEIRNARKHGADGIRVNPVYSVPHIRPDYWTATMEACLLTGELDRAVSGVFDMLDERVRHSLTFTPRDGEWPARARFWKSILKPALPPEQYYRAMELILAHYARCVRRRRNMA